MAHDVCIQLMGPLLGMGYHLYTEGTNLTGTVRGNRKYLPKGVKHKLSKGDSIAYRKEKLVCVGWQDKKHVILLSTEGLSKMITYTSKRNREINVQK